MAKTDIGWCSHVWNPVIGCTKVSDGCQHCYAERMAVRLSAMAIADIQKGRNPGRKMRYRDVATKRGWSGRLALQREALEDPYRWRKPRLVFVNSMSDLFHEKMPGDWIDQIFRAMAENPEHTFQVLTKRPAKALEYSRGLRVWPDNVWIGTSVEHGKVLPRVRTLRRIPARVRFISAEPLLGSLKALNLAGIHWLIAGGESGPNSRSMHPDWVRELRDAALWSGVPFFFKQWGAQHPGNELDGVHWEQFPTGAPGF